MAEIGDIPTVSFHALAEALKKAQTQPFALQMGAMDGVRFDLLHPHLIKGGWAGLLIEPVPDMFELLRQTYAGQGALAFANCAVADYDGVLKLHRIDPAAIASGQVAEEGLGVTTSVVERSFVGIPAYKEKYGAFTQEIEVPCFRLAHILEQYGVTAIDLVMIDTEGADWMIAQQLDLGRFNPAVICLEYVFMNGEEMQACCAHFMTHGYTFGLCTEDSQNLVFYK